MGAKYHKIYGPYKRRDAKPHDVLEGEWTRPEYGYLANNLWRWTEKVDGTNIRIMWDGHKVRYGGRTDNAQIPVKLIDELDTTFGADGIEEVFEQTFEDATATIYGEGYGGSIQRGERYLPYERFIVFDVRVGDWWLQPEDVTTVADIFTLPVVPYHSFGTIHDAIAAVRKGVFSQLSLDSELYAEGLVGTPLIPLYNRRGERIICKVKQSDFPRERG